LSASKNGTKDNSIIIQFIVRGVYESDRTASREPSDFAELLTMLAEFRNVPPTKLFPARGIVPEPFPQFGTRCDILKPVFYRGSFLAEPAGPEAVDQDAYAIFGQGMLIGPL
jgi:hypothetical protein